jgi:glyoxylate utilization-related uncharacterized protein
MSEGTIKVFSVYDTPVLIQEEGREQIRRIVTTKTAGAKAFSFHVTHFDGGHERLNSDVKDEEVLYILQGEITVSYNGEEHTLVQGSALYFAPGATFRHKVGVQGVTFAVICSPPRE